MDTSETYIKMCEEATELQFAWKGGLGDVVRHQGKGVIYYTKPSDLLQGDGCVWLPRQDQLQEMVFDKFRLQMPGFRINDLQCWCKEHMLANYRSMEQLWLAFYMAEKHGKYWTDEGWKSRDKHQD